jgi:hypothetical protein
MNLSSSLPEEKRTLLESLTAQLAAVPHMQAVVLGGSYASGTAHSASDLDIGLYYLEAQPFPLEQIRAVAASISLPDQPPVVTGFHEWGAWVNGGAWVFTPAGKVDFLYRSLDHVRKTIEEARQGICRHDYDQQPTYGYYSTGYLAETHICIPLYDPQGVIAELKQQVAVYPEKLKQKIIADSLWSAEFTLNHARGFAEKGDIYNTTGCLGRASASLTQALFALNEVYFLSDKKVMEKLASFRVLPEGYARDLLSILAHPGETRPELERAVARLDAVWQSVTALAGAGYRRKF